MSHSKPSGALEQGWAWYQRQLSLNPIKTKVTTAVVLQVLGNITATKLIQKKPVQLSNLFKFAVWGSIIAPILHYWYQYLERLYRGKKSTSVLVQKLLLDQLAFAPLANILFYTLMSVLDGVPSAAPARIKALLFPTLKASWRIFPLARLIAFKYIPVQYQSLYGNMIGFLWNIYISILSTRAVVPDNLIKKA